MSLHPAPTVAALCATVLLIASLSAASAATPPIPPREPSPALQRWASDAADPAEMQAVLLRHADKVPAEFDERLKWADADGSLQVMVSLSSRDDRMESFIAANTAELAWYGDDPRFLARVTPAQLISLLGSPSVLFVEPDYPITNFMSDSAADVRARTSGTDGVYSFDPTTGPLGRLVSNVPGLTAQQVTGAGVRVAITDSGIDKTHRDFGGWDCTPGPYQPCESRIVETVTTDHLVPGFESSDALPTTEAASGHGTHVAGTIAGNGYYSRNIGADAARYGGDGYVIGIAPNAELVSVKNGDSQWAGLSSFALQWQLDNAEELGLKASSNSWGCLGGCSFNGSSATGQLLRDLYNAGIVVTFAVGNDGGGPDGASFSGNAQSPYVLGVASYNDANDQLVSTSSRGSSSAPLYDAATWTPESEPVNGTRRPDVAAPGNLIWSAASLTGGTAAGLPRLSIGDVDQGQGPTVEYRQMSGTSMATPHVSGTAALLSSACPAAKPLDVMRSIIAGANGTKVKKTGGGGTAEPFEVGYGGLDVRASLDRLLTLEVCGGEGDPDPDPTPTPTPSPTASPEPPSAPEVPSDEDANVVDPFGDANYVNDQGTDGDTGVFVGDGVTPADTADVADVGKVWFTESGNNLSVHVQTEAEGPASEGLFFRVEVDPGSGTRCLWFQAATAGAGNLGGNEATLRDTCPSAVPTSNGTLSFFDGPEGTGIMSLTFPFTAHPALGSGKVLGSPAAHSRNFIGVVTAPQIDNTLPGTDYKIGEGADPSPSPTPTPTGEPTPTPTSTPSESPAPDTTTVNFTERSEMAGQYSDESLFEARLINSGGDPIENAELSFELTGSESSRTFTATTDGDGIASVTSALDERPGPYQLTVRYAGDGEHESSADTVSFVVDKEDSALDLTETKGKDKALVATLYDSDTPADGIAGRTIDFYAGAELLGSATTDADGVATFEPPKQKGKKQPYEGRFEGDDFYLGSSDQEAGKGKGGKGGNGAGG